MEKDEAMKYKAELDIESFKAAHDALEEMYQMAERKVEWNISDFTSGTKALEIRYILSEAIVKAKELLNKSFKEEFNLED